jgi:hypothetical protein
MTPLGVWIGILSGLCQVFVLWYWVFRKELRGCHESDCDSEVRRRGPDADG